LNVVEFGNALLRTGDLDPIYIMLHRAGLVRHLLLRWCLAYWCFYHAGTACRIVDAHSLDFWRQMRRADREKWPRGTERRHFRGAASAKSIEYLACRFPDPSVAVYAVIAPTFSEVAKRVQFWPGFGPWIAFKVADMLDRVLSVPVDFADCELGVYSEPRAGAALVAKEQGLAQDLGSTVRWLLSQMWWTAPPRHDRPLNIQEAETILCKYKAHKAGHYPIGKDTREIRHALEGAGPLAAHLLEFLP
jgi:hypothetical protein